MTLIIEPKIYIACLAAYNDGILHGIWVDAAIGVKALRKSAQMMLSTSPVKGAEEYAIHDHEGFGSIGLHEYESLQSVAEKAEFIVDHKNIGLAVLDHCAGDISDAEDMIERFCGEFVSLADYAEDFVSQSENLHEHLAYYIDYQAMARDMELSGDIMSIEVSEDRVLIFSN